MFSPELLQHIALARLVLLGTVGMLVILAIITTRQKNNPAKDAINSVSTIWSIAIGVAWAAGAAIILLPAHTLLWGNQGDEAFQIAFMEKVISGHPFTDFFYAHLSPFYPPLYFWIFGTIGRLFNWDGIVAAQWGTILTYAFLPLAALVFAKLCRWTTQEQRTVLFLSIATLFCIPAEALLLKPYEAAAALLSVLWIVAFTKVLREPSWRLRIILGVTGGVIFLTYYFWFVLLIPAMVGLIVFRHAGHRSGIHRNQENDGSRVEPRMTQDALSFITIGIIVTTMAMPFLIPYIIDFARFGHENYQATYFFPTDADLYAPWLSLSLAGLLALGSLVTYIAKRTWSDAQIASLALLGSIFAWHGVQLIVLAFGGKPIMLSKPFLFLGSIALFLPAVEYMNEKIDKQLGALGPSYRQGLLPRILIATILMISPLLPNGLFLDDPKIQTQLEQNLLPQTSAFVAENIRIFVPDYADRTWLVSGLQDLNGTLPFTHYLAWNPHFSNPAAHWGSRLEELQRISHLSSAAETTQAFDDLGINALLFYRATDEQENPYYPFFYEEDAWPNGTESRELRFDEKLISLEDWQVAHEDNEWRVLLRK